MIHVVLFSGWEYAFDKINTLNLNTPYDYNSVMQYHKLRTLPSLFLDRFD